MTDCCNDLQGELQRANLEIVWTGGSAAGAALGLFMGGNPLSMFAGSLIGTFIAENWSWLMDIGPDEIPENTWYNRLLYRTIDIGDEFSPVNSQPNWDIFFPDNPDLKAYLLEAYKGSMSAFAVLGEDELSQIEEYFDILAWNWFNGSKDGSIFFASIFENNPWLINTLGDTAVNDSGEDVEGSLLDYLIGNPNLLLELENSHYMTDVIGNLLEAEQLQAILGQELFQVSDREGNILFDQAVQAAVNRALGIEEGAAIFNQEGENPTAVELDAEGKPINPFEQMRAEIQAIRDGITNDLNARIGRLESSIQLAADLRGDINALRAGLEAVKAKAGTCNCSCNKEYGPGENPALNRDLINENPNDG